MNDFDLKSLQNPLILNQQSKRLGAILEEQSDTSHLQSDDSFGNDEGGADDGIHDLVDIKPQLSIEKDIELKKSNSTQHKNDLKSDPNRLRINKRNLTKKISNLSHKENNANFSRLKTETSTTSTLNLLSKSLTVSLINSKQFKDEELLVIHYISIVIRLLKLSDALKAINEYNKKEGLSKRAQAHLAKLQGVLTMLSEKKEYKEAKKHFDTAFNLFHKIGSTKGRAICRLALVRAQCEIELNKGSGGSELQQILSTAEKTKLQFHEIGHKAGEERANQYILFIQQRINGEKVNTTGLQKLVKFKTLKRTHIDSVKADNASLEKSMLNNEDIRLFVEVIEEDDDKRDQYRRITTSKFKNRDSRSNSVTKEIPRSLYNSESRESVRSSANSLSVSQSNLTIKLRKSKFMKQIRNLAKNREPIRLKRRIKDKKSLSISSLPHLNHRSQHEVKNSLSVLNL